MTVQTFDPWETEDPGAAVKVETMQVGEGEKAFPASLYLRGKKRVGDVTRTSGRTWHVAANERLGDVHGGYEVRWLGGDEYECECWGMDHGESRAVRGCSHVVAVMIRRAQFVEGTGPAGKSALPVAPTVGASVPSTNSAPAVDDPLWTRHDPVPWPAKFTEIHAYQYDAMQEVVEAFDRGVKVVFVDAPTGTGKSVIGEGVRRLVGERAFYSCHSKSLQSQFVGDFGYSKLMMGRANYPTLDGPRDSNCGDCTSEGAMDPCLWCGDKWQCPYEVAKREATRSELAVVNSAYMLSEFNYVGKVGADRELGIVDEVDTLEGELLGFVQFSVGDRALGRMALTPPKEGSHRTTIGRWIVDELEPATATWAKSLRGEGLEAVRERKRVERLRADVLRLVREIDEDEGLKNWVRDGRAGPMVLKPIVVRDAGERYVWEHADKWLGMSATIVSPDELAQSLGVGDDEFSVVSVDSQFAVENRQVIVAPVADMSRRGKEAGEWEYMVKAVGNVIDRHPGERVLVHTVSYELSKFLLERLSNDRPFVTYSEAKGRDAALGRFRRTRGAVMLASSMDRGVDLAGDDCRVVVCAKVPFPNLGDRQISERLRAEGGGLWYSANTVRGVVQMFGRAVRNKDDYAVGYLLDRQWVSNVWKKSRGLVPKWFQEGLVWDFPVKELLR